MQAFIGKKTEQVARFLEDGKRIPVTVIRMPELSVAQIKTLETDGYTAVQLGVDTKKAEKATKPLKGHVNKSGVKIPLFLREIRLTSDETAPELGSNLNIAEIIEAGDIVWVTGMSKGKGFAGGVKRYGFRGGPRTHGQSDRERAPGSIGQTTTPGRVYKGKKMAGNMGNEQVTIKNLVVVSVNPEENSIMVSGLVPGIIGGFVTVAKKGTAKNFVPLLKNAVESQKEAEEAAKAQAEVDRITQEEAAKAPATEEPTAEATTEAAPAEEAAADIVEPTVAPTTDEPTTETPSEAPAASEEKKEEKA